MDLKDTLVDIHGLANALDMLAWVAADEGRHRRAAWIFGAAGTLWTLLGKQRLLGNPSLLALHARAEDAARTALGEQRYRQGERLARQTAVQLAVRDLDALPDRPEAAQRPAATDALTRREREAAALVTQGLSNREIAEKLVISKRTADAHVEHILAKLGFSSRSEIAPLVAGESRTVNT